MQTLVDRLVSLLTRVRSWVRASLHREDLDRVMNDELRFHIETLRGSARGPRAVAGRGEAPCPCRVWQPRRQQGGVPGGARAPVVGRAPSGPALRRPPVAQIPRVHDRGCHVAWRRHRRQHGHFHSRRQARSSARSRSTTHGGWSRSIGRARAGRAPSFRTRPIGSCATTTPSSRILPSPVVFADGASSFRERMSPSASRASWSRETTSRFLEFAQRSVDC